MQESHRRPNSNTKLYRPIFNGTVGIVLVEPVSAQSVKSYKFIDYQCQWAIFGNTRSRSSSQTLENAEPNSPLTNRETMPAILSTQVSQFRGNRNILKLSSVPCCSRYRFTEGTYSSSALR